MFCVLECFFESGSQAPDLGESGAVSLRPPRAAHLAFPGGTAKVADTAPASPGNRLDSQKQCEGSVSLNDLSSLAATPPIRPRVTMSSEIGERLFDIVALRYD